MDEQVLSYAEVKALCAGNPAHQGKDESGCGGSKAESSQSRPPEPEVPAEDKLLKEFPASIQCQKAEIAALQQDAKTAETNPQVKDGFCGMTVKGMHFEDKLAAGERLLLACKEMPTAETVTLGNYRGFGLDLRFDTFRNEYQAVLRGASSHFVPLGTDARGNLSPPGQRAGQLPRPHRPRREPSCRLYISSGTRRKLRWKSLSPKKRSWLKNPPVWPSWTPC